MRAPSYDLFLCVITRNYLLLHYMERKRLLGGISKNFWEFDWLRAHHLLTCYYALLRAITRYYLLLHYMERKRLLGEFLRISGNLIGYARIIL